MRKPKLFWEQDVGQSIDVDTWTQIWQYAGNISISNRTKHHLQTTPLRRHKCNPNFSPFCLKCKIEEGDFVHCIWKCVHINAYWVHICRRLSLIFHTQCDLNPLYLLLGVADKNMKSISDGKLFNFLTYAARKSILLKRISDKPLTVSEWHQIIFDFLSLEYLTYCSDGKINVFYLLYKYIYMTKPKENY